MAKIPYRKPKADGSGAMPAISLTRKDPKLAALVSKTTKGRQPMAYDNGGINRSIVSNGYQVRAILNKRAKRNTDAKSIVKLLPDIELSIQILTSSILSPKDMTSVDLIYSAPKNVLSSELSASMSDFLKEYFETAYKLRTVVPEMLREPLFEKGSYPIAVIPENAIDDFINGDRTISTEALSEFTHKDGSIRNIGILGSPGTPRSSKLGVSLESLRPIAATTNERSNRLTYTDMANLADEKDLIAEWDGKALEEYVIVTDNPATLRMPRINDIAKKKVVNKAYSSSSFGVESLENIPDSYVANKLFANKVHRSQIVGTLKHQNELKRRSVGNPLIMKLPSESVLPVHVPGNPKQHIGYFVLLDEEGNPIEAPDGDHLHPGIQRDQNNSVSTNLIRKAAMNMGIDQDQFDPRNTQHIQYVTQLYAELVERDLVSRVKNGVYTGNVTIARNEEIYRLMLARTSANKYCQLLYIPVEYMTYIAFKYTDDGVGKSLIDDYAMLYTIRTVLLFNDVISSVKNSIGRTKVNLTLDPSDPNPMKTIEEAQDEIVRSRMVGMPLGVSSPVDIIEFIQRSGYEWDIKGHPGLPDTAFEFMNQQTQIPKSDPELQDALRKATIMGLGLSPETVDNGFNTEFAATAVANNILLSKRVIAWQDQFTPMLTDHLRKVALNTEDVITGMKDLLNENEKDILIDLTDEEKKLVTDEEERKRIRVSRAIHAFIGGFELTLPKPSSVTMDTQLAELNSYASALDAALDSYLSSDLFSKTVTGDLSDQATSLKAMYKAYFIRKWMAEKNIMSELATIVAPTGDDAGGVDITDEVVKYTEEISKHAVTALTKLTANVTAVNKDLAAKGVDLSGGTSFSDTTTTDADGMGGFGMGGDDFNMGGDFGAPPADDLAGNGATDATDDPTATGAAEASKEGTEDKDTTTGGNPLGF